MGNTIQTFAHERFGQVRTISADDETWFIAADICQALELSNPSVAVSRLDDDEKAKFNLGFSGGATWCVNEPGLYALIMASRKPEAKAFKRWVTHDVLPSIRRHGLYAIEELVTNPDALLEVLRAYADEKRKNHELTSQNLAQAQALAEAKPKLSYYDMVLQSKDALPITVIAKDYGLSGRKLNQLLHELGVQYKQSGLWLLYAEHAGNGYTDTKTHVIDEGNHTRIHTYWTQKGRLFIYDLLKNQLGLLPVIEQNGGDVA
ncbi:phage antirepressor KilAC domain-containing protein [Trueperella pyogenes]|uniref:phage antirepressor n=1 Tax=Trueperella pyogenes TaxID=1661 RepID=UPI003250429E